MTDCPKEAPQANEICLQSCEKKIKRSRWDIQTDTRVSDATIDSVSGASGVAKILETSQGCVNFSLTEKRKDEEGSVAFNYPRLLPLDTPYLRMEVIGRLQLALWGEKALHQAALKEQQKEKEKIVYVTQLVCAVLLFLIQSRQSLSQKSSSSHCDDDDDDENVSQSIDGQYSEKVADRLNPLFLYQEKSCKDSTGTFQEDSETDTTWSVFAESYQKIFNKAWTMCTDYINSPSGEDHVSQDLQAFLQRIQCAKPFAPPENISPEENYIFRGLLFENQTLRSSLVSCEKKCDRLELVVEQCRKQISIYLSRDPATPQVIDLDHFLMVESLKYDAPEVFLSCVPKLIRSLQQLESNNTMKTCLLNEALECIDSLKKESCEKDLLIHRLEHRLSTLTEQAEHIREIPKANIQKFCQLEEHINQLHLEKAELLERVNEISLSRVRSETEIEALLRRKCSSLESEKKDLQERKKEVELLLIELKNQVGDC